MKVLSKIIDLIFYSIIGVSMLCVITLVSSTFITFIGALLK